MDNPKLSSDKGTLHDGQVRGLREGRRSRLQAR